MSDPSVTFGMVFASVEEGERPISTDFSSSAMLVDAELEPTIIIPRPG